MTGLLVGTISLVLIFAASAAPIPLYSTYLEQLGLPRSDLSVATVAYFVGTISSILVFARLSDYVGRKPVIFLALLFSALGCVCFSILTSEAMLFFGRFLQGLACGIASGAAGAYVVDNAPKKPAWLAAVITTSSPQFGLTIGSLMSACFAASSSRNLSVSFLILIGCFVASAVALAFSRETMTRKRGAIRSMVPRVSFPQRIRSLLPACACTFVGTWAVGGFYQACSSSMASMSFGGSSVMLAAVVFAAFMAPSILGGPLVGSVKPRAAQRLGMVAFLLCVAMVVVSLALSSGILLVVASLFGGIAQGAAYSGAMRRVIGRIDQNDSAGVLSGVTLISYAGAAIPNMVIGLWGAGWDILPVSVGYLALVSFCSIVMIGLDREREGSRCNA